LSRKQLNCAAVRVVAGIGDADFRSRSGAFLSPVDSSYVRFRLIANHKMKTRCFDHIDLRVKDMKIAKEF